MSVFEGLKEMASSALDTLARNADALRNAPTALQKAVVNNPRVIAVADSIISSAEQSVQSIQKETQGYRQAIAQEGLVKGAAFRTMENIGRTTDAMMESDVAPVALAGNILNRAKLMAVDGIAQGAADTLTGTKDAFVTVGTGIGEGIAKAVVSLEQK